jgi:hypothetical protein
VFSGYSRRAPSGKVTATILFTPVAHSLPTGCSVSDAPIIDWFVWRRFIYGHDRVVAIVAEAAAFVGIREFEVR